MHEPDAKGVGGGITINNAHERLEGGEEGEGAAGVYTYTIGPPERKE